MSFFDDLFGSREREETASTANIDPRDINSLFGNISGGQNEPLSITSSPEMEGLFKLFANIGGKSLEGLQNFDRQGFENTQLDRLRSLSKRGEENRSSQLISSLFNRGILGRNVGTPGINGGPGGTIQPELFQEQLLNEEADLQRMLQAIGLGGTEADRLFNRGLGSIDAMNAAAKTPLALGALSGTLANTTGTGLSKKQSSDSPFDVISGVFSSIF